MSKKPVSIFASAAPQTMKIALNALDAAQIPYCYYDCTFALPAKEIILKAALQSDLLIAAENFERDEIDRALCRTAAHEGLHVKVVKCAPERVAQAVRENSTFGELVDVTTPLARDMQVYPGDPATELRRIADFDMGAEYRVSTLFASLHAGTHIDAPAHCIQNGKNLEEIPIETFCGECALLDLAGGKKIRAHTLKKFPLEAGMAVLLKLQDGYHKPSVLTPDAAAYLIEKGVCLVGTDMLSIGDTALHKMLLEQSIPVLENLFLREAEQGPYRIFAFPVKIRDAESAFVRCILEKK